MAKEKCEFGASEVLFLGYVISAAGLWVDLQKVDVVLSWPTPTMISEVCCFHSLASLYRRVVHNFSAIMAPITDCVKNTTFTLSPEAAEAFTIIK